MNYEEIKRKVYRLVSKIPEGKVSTYKIIGDIVGVKSYRLVGKALKENYNKDVPCHRVIMNNGKLGGYNKGIDEKIEILKKEGHKILWGEVVNFKDVLFDFKNE